MVEKKKVPVKKHKRKYPSGKSTVVKKHSRKILSKPKISESMKKEIKEKEAIQLDILFFESKEKNPRLKLTRFVNDVKLEYHITTPMLSIAKKTVSDLRKENVKAYYFIGGIKGRKVYRIYMSEKYPETDKVDLDESMDADEIIKIQREAKDWAHYSEKYPNLIGVTDEEINEYLEQQKGYYAYLGKEDAEKYLKAIRCYNSSQLLDACARAGEDFRKRNSNLANDKENPFLKEKTIYLTSPRGGHEILSDYAYANKLCKTNIPFDLYTINDREYGKILCSRSLPYSYEEITDVNDIVYVDDICMSGEQENAARKMIHNLLINMNIKDKQMPRIHYIAIVGNRDRFHNYGKEDFKFKYYGSDPIKWDSVTAGDLYNFDYKYNYENKNCASAIVFPYSIPDGARHERARKLYKKTERFRHSGNW